MKERNVNKNIRRKIDHILAEKEKRVRQNNKAILHKLTFLIQISTDVNRPRTA